MKKFGLMVMYVLIGAGLCAMFSHATINVHYDNRPQPKGMVLIMPEETNAPAEAAPTPQAERRTL